MTPETDVLKIPHYVSDRLYKKIEFSPDELKLLQTREMTRLKQISLSAVPPWIIPVSTAASRFEHSLGAAHLARIVGSRPEFAEVAKDLVLAAYGHDLGSPPFSHLGETYLKLATGRSHEQFVAEIMDGSEFADEVKRQGGDLQRVLRFIEGEEPPFSDLINGTIDVDNLDNTLRFALSTGLVHEVLYSPENLARAFAMQDGQLVILPGFTKDLEQWEYIRQITYSFVYSHANHSSGMMLYRALDFAAREGDLHPDFFRMTDAEAFLHLLNNTNSRTKTLTERAERWIYYPQVFSYVSATPSAEITELCSNPQNRGVLADEISAQLGVAPEDVCLYMGKNKGFKQIHIPILNGEKTENHKPKSSLTWMAHVYIHPGLVDRADEVRDYMRQRLNLPSIRKISE